jgi:hypothetical protein
VVTSLTSQVIPGPAKYQGKYDVPKDAKPEVSMVDRGVFPAEFEAKYEAYKAKIDKHSLATATTVNKIIPGGKGGKSEAKGEDLRVIQEFYKGHNAEAKVLDTEFLALKKEAVRMGLVRS